MWRRRTLRTLDRYLAVAAGQGVLLALIALVAVFFVINATEELRQVGTGQYGVREALWFSTMTLPNEACVLLPAAALLGCVIGLDGLVRRYEIVAIAAAGVSPGRVVASLLRLAVGLAAVGLLFSEFIAAPLTYRARTERSIALSNAQTLGGGGGIWTRSGSSFVNIRTLLPDGTARDIYVYDFDPQRRLRRFSYAQSATYTDHHWVARGLVDRVLTDDGVSIEPVGRWPLPIETQPAELDRLRIPPEELSLADLSRGIGAARRQRESAAHLELAWWQRASMPALTVIMVFLGAGLIVSARPMAARGGRLILGALLGIGFQMVNQTFATFGLVYGLAPWLSASLPSLLALACGLWLLTRRVP